MLTATDRKKGAETFQHEMEMLFRENHERVYRAAYGVTGSKEDAEDVLQTVFLRLIAGSESPSDFCRNPKGYLHRAAVNEALHVKETRKRQRLTDADVNTLEIQAPTPESGHDEDLLRMRAAIARMKPEFVEVLNLRYKEEYSCRDIAKLRRRPLRTVLSDLFRARAELKKLIRIEEKNSEKQEEKHAADRRPVLANSSQA